MASASGLAGKRLSPFWNGIEADPAGDLLTRAVSVQSEAATIVAGVARMPVARFVLVTRYANRGLAGACAGLGAFATGRESFVLVFLASVTVPVAAFAVHRGLAH